MGRKRSEHHDSAGIELADDFAGAPEPPATVESDAGEANVSHAKPPDAPAAPSKDRPPPFGTPKPAGSGSLPRVVSELARAEAGTVRYKIACRNYTPQKSRYILAETDDEDGAVVCYLRANGLDRLLAKLRGRAQKPEDVERPELVVTELPD